MAWNPAQNNTFSRICKSSIVLQDFLGLMEFAGVDKDARSKMGVRKMQEWTHRHDMARVDIAGVDNAAPLWQGWTMQEWSEVTKAAYKITSLANDSLYI